ncbi:type II secretion system protein [Bordetella parapertussis]|uniref:Membrane protein n=1 Tax=Bordetella parapertussis (strain Bpp5) TaxID=1208660 RepID=K0MDK4_BORPB|nr:prepilin-type N-terminal cleavage/methylation domain-containing protein [Bordetella parapertussis]CCJ48071.1 putative membrane protein [Bordetella parapertussis Bpp5]
MTRRVRPSAAGRQQGYTLLEVAIALAVVGLLGAGLYGAQQALYSHGSQGQAQAEAERARQAVLAYAALRVPGGPDLFRPSAGAAPVDYSPGGEAALYETLRRADQSGVRRDCARHAGGALPVFSAAHAALARGAALCAIAPAGGRANQNSDAVAAVGTAELLGWLAARAH